jgi:hypothetical protein
MLVFDLDTSLQSVAMTCHERLADTLAGKMDRTLGAFVPPWARSASSSRAPAFPTPAARRFTTLDIDHGFNSLD